MANVLHRPHNSRDTPATPVAASVSGDTSYLIQQLCSGLLCPRIRVLWLAYTNQSSVWGQMVQLIGLETEFGKGVRRRRARANSFCRYIGLDELKPMPARRQQHLSHVSGTE